MNLLKSKKGIIFFICLLCLTEFALAAGGGLTNVNKLFENIAMVLKGVGVIILTVAVMVAGYKVMWGGSTVREVAPLIIGGVLIGSASYFAGLILE